MIDDPAALANAFRGTPLEGREVTTYRMAGTGELMLSVDVGEPELVPLWSAARELVPRTGRWPFAGNGIPREPLAELGAVKREACGGQANGAAAGLERADRVAALLRSARLDAWTRWATLPEMADRHLRFTAARCGIAPDAAELLGRVADNADEFELERALMAWEEEHAPNAPAPQSEYLDWFFDGPTAWLLFPPTSSGACSVLYSGIYFVEAAPGLTPARLVTMLEAWRQAYGAEVVANWGTMLELLVARPPTTLQAAWPLAIQHVLVAPDALGGRTVRDHARNLVGRKSWFLHTRP